VFLLCGLLCFLFGCHLIYSPFPFFMDLKCNGRLLQLIDV